MDKKKPESELDKEHIIPKMTEGCPTDVVAQYIVDAADKKQ